MSKRNFYFETEGVLDKTKRQQFLRLQFLRLRRTGRGQTLTTVTLPANTRANTHTHTQNPKRPRVGQSRKFIKPCEKECRVLFIHL
jgi:hypothetical protein